MASDQEVLAAAVAMRACGAHTWQEIAARVGLPATTIEMRYRRRPADMQPEPCPVCDPAPSEGRPYTFTERGNYARAQAIGTGPQGLDDLIMACGADLEVWQVRDWGAKRWEVGAKAKEGQLRFDEGRITGWLDHKGLQVQELWSTWADFVRRAPIPIHPVIQPVHCPAPLPASPVATVAHPNAGRALIFGDTQWGFRAEPPSYRLEPFHDRRALDVVLQIARHEQPAVIVHCGDLLDNTDWTDRFLRSPEFRGLTQPVILECFWYLARLRAACPAAKIVIIEGNHDARITGALITHLAAAYGLRPADQVELPPALSAARLLALHDLGIGWIGPYPEAEYWLGTGLRVTHGDRASSVPGATARAIVDSAAHSVIFGHIHRIEQASKTLHGQNGGKPVTARSVGCTCRLDGIVPSKGGKQNWQQSLAVVDFAGDQSSVYDIEIREGRALWAGRVFEGQDWAPELRRALEGWNW